jgi:anti-sigma B factor antagonist
MSDRPPTVETTSDDDGTTIVRVGGDLDIGSVPGVEAELEPILASGAAQIAFDLSGVSFMDSSGIAMLLRVAARVTTIEIREASASVQLIISATGLADFLHAEP